MNAKRWAIAAVAAVVFVAGSLFFGGAFRGGKSPPADWRIRFPNGVVHELLPHLKGGNSLGGWRRVAVEPFPIYVEFPVSGLEFRFERERIYLNGRLYGIVMRNYDDLERNAAKLGQVRFLMCYGRLGDERTFGYLRRMESLRAVSILSPMPADLEALARYRPEIEVLDLNCAYWPCEFPLSRFGRLAVLSVRGKYWRRMYDGEEVSVRRLYLGEGKPSDLPERRSGLEVLEISVSGAEELGELWKAAGEMPSLRVLYVKASYVPGEDFCEGIPGDVEELSVILDSGLYWRDEARRFVERTAAERGGVLFHTNVLPSGGYDGDVPFPVFSYLGGKLVSVTSDAARLEEVLEGSSKRSNSCFLYRCLNSDSFTLRTRISGFKEGLRVAVVQKRIKYLKVYGALDMESAELICEKFPFLGRVFLMSDQTAKVVSALLKGLPDDCAVYATMNEKEYAGGFSAGQLERLRVFLSVKEEIPASLTETEAGRIVGVSCNTDRESLSRLKMFRNLKSLWLDLTTLDIGESSLKNLVLDEFSLVRWSRYTIEDPQREEEMEDDCPEVQKYLKWRHEVLKRLCRVDAKRFYAMYYEFSDISRGILKLRSPEEYRAGLLGRMKPHRQLLVCGSSFYGLPELFGNGLSGERDEGGRYFEITIPGMWGDSKLLWPERWNNSRRYLTKIKNDDGRSCVILREMFYFRDKNSKPTGISSYLYSHIFNYYWPESYNGFDVPEDYYWEYFEKAHLGDCLEAFRF